MSDNRGMKEVSRAIILLWTLFFLTVFVGRANALPIENGDFEAGLDHWTTFSTLNGDLGIEETPAILMGRRRSAAVIIVEAGAEDFPKTLEYEVALGKNSYAAAFRVGKLKEEGASPAGGGISQQIELGAGAWAIMLNIAVLDDSGTANGDGGLFELLFDSVVVDSHDFGDVTLDVPERSMLSFTTALLPPGKHEVGIQMTRDHGQDSTTPVQYIDDVVMFQVAIPEPATILLLGTSLMVGLAYRRKLWRS
jgi:hypothetical protein